MKVIVRVLCIFFIQSLHAQTVAIINAPNMRYRLTSPSGWYFYQPVYETGRITLLFPNGETKESSKRFIYTLDMPYEADYETVEQVLQGDINGSNTAAADVQVLQDSTIALSIGVTARVIYF